MNSSRPRDPSRDPPYAGPRQHAGVASEPRNGYEGSVNTSGSASTDGMTRAQKFEDEKRRIIESCFSKKDTDGSQVESYITHIQVTEDALYPSAPAPPDSGAENKKPRVIIVAVRKSGRVRVHKARENNSGSFSIGKTWNLDDLGPIQSWTGVAPATEEEQQLKQWASDIGFVVTLGKPYYWQASTSREREFFIGSLIKIYRKYTGGKLPEMIGFDPAEQGQLTGIPIPRTSPEPQVRSPPFRPNMPPPAPSAGSNRPQSPHVGRGPPPESERSASRNGQRPPDRETQRTPGRDDIRSPSRGEFRAPSREGLRDQGPNRRPPPNQESISGVLKQNVSGKPRAPYSANSSQSSLPPVLGLPSNPRPSANGPATMPPQNDDALRRLAGRPSDGSLVNRSEDGTSNASRPSTASSAAKPPETRMDRNQTPEPSQEALPERRRPPYQRPAGSFGQVSAQSDNNSTFSTPLPTPTNIKNDKRAPQRAAEQARNEPSPGAPSMPGYFPSPAEAEIALRNQSPLTSPSSLPTPNEVKAITSPTESPITSPTSLEGEEYRPGLGPMMRKKKSGKEIANQFRKAAMAANAFKPRAGGAAERLLTQKEKSPNEPDGITGVVPAPLLRGTSNDSGRTATPDVLSPASEKDRPLSPVANRPTPTIQLQRTPTEERLPPETEDKRERRAASPEKPRSRSPGRRKRQLQEARLAKYCTALGIDSKVVEGRGGDFDDLLTEIGWDGKLPEEKKIEDFEADIRREIGRAQASGWLGHVEQQEGKLDQLGKLFDRTIEECDELDGLLTLYSHELNTLAEDVAYIEAQSQGLQVQTANQKLLQVELQNLLRTISISSADLRDLRQVSLGTPDGVEAAEQSLTVLYKAMITIDPDIRQNKKRQADAAAGNRNDIGIYADTELGQMRAVREKKEDYRDETSMFLKRLSQYMSMAFKSAEARANDSVEKARGNTMISATSLDSRIHDSSRHELWMYNALMLFVREVNSYEWQTLISTYETYTKPTYQEQFRDNVLAWKKITRKPTVEELDFLFTTQEKEKPEDGITTAARKLTVKRGKTVRATGSLGKSVGDKRDGKVDAHEAVAGALEGQLKLISEEQNFTVSFFHLSSLSNVDFAEIVAGRSPAQRRLPNLSAKQTYDPDRDMAKMVERMMDSIYTFWPTDMQNLVEWALSNDSL
jgi:exocyst complex component 1